MTDTNKRPGTVPGIDPERRLTSDAELAEFLGDLLQRATHRQFWMLFLDDEQRLMEPIMPMDDHPLDPGELAETEDLGLAPFARVVVDRVGMIVEWIGASSVVFVWERRGPDKFTPEDRAWAGGFADESGRVGLPLRAQFVLHSRGLRQIAADDYAV